MKALPGRYETAVQETKRRLLRTALEAEGSMRKAAVWLGVSVATVSRDCKQLGITLQTPKPQVLVRKVI